jgi:hypothetical protein
LFRRLSHGVAVCVLPRQFDSYFMTIDGSARRNYKKAQRGGYEFSRIDYNSFLDDITAIRRSTDRRQGKLPEEFLSQPARPVTDPPSRSPSHDYPYFGVRREGKLYSYAGCLVAGELCMLQHIFGHAAFQSDGIVPLLIVSIAKYLLAHHPEVKYYAYGTFFGAGETMRRFKTKFAFVPHRVTWQLG